MSITKLFIFILFAYIFISWILSGTTYHEIRNHLTTCSYHLVLPPTLTTRSYHLILPTGRTTWSYLLVLPPGLTNWLYNLVLLPLVLPPLVLPPLVLPPLVLPLGLTTWSYHLVLQSIFLGKKKGQWVLHLFRRCMFIVLLILSICDLNDSKWSEMNLNESLCG